MQAIGGGSGAPARKGKRVRPVSDEASWLGKGWAKFLKKTGKLPDYPPLQKRARLSRNDKACLSSRQLEVRTSLNKDENKLRKDGPDCSDSSGRRYAVPFKYLFVGEAENALKFMAFWEKDTAGCGEPYFSVARVLLLLKKQASSSKLSSDEQQELLENFAAPNPLVWKLIAKQTFIPHACDKYGCVSSGGSYEAHNVVEEALEAFKSVPGAIAWVKKTVERGGSETKEEEEEAGEEEEESSGEE